MHVHVDSLNTANTRVSNKLGAGRPEAARLAVRVVMFLAILEGLIMGVVLVSVRRVWGHAYSDEEEVVTYVAKMVLVIAVSNFLDGIQSVLSGVARGCGWQKICACINLGAFYAVGIPAAYLLAFVLHVGGMVRASPRFLLLCLYLDNCNWRVNYNYLGILESSVWLS
ncbi:Protein TRANSPARENT TESTA 12 [Hordeum vulgare]|nr:Protein TRANSPARENT TESTA 12 [Hordeum vulgare]